MHQTESPTVNDFLARLYMLRDDAAARAREETKAITTRNAARGLLRSGATLKALAALIESEFEATLTEMLSALRQWKTLSADDYAACRDQSFLRAQDLIAVLIGACEMEKWYAMLGSAAAATAIRNRLAELLPRLKYRMRQFDVGLDKVATAGSATVTNNVVNAHIINGIVQQAGEGAALHAAADLHLEGIADASSILEQEIRRSDDAESREVRQIASDVAMIRAQLSAPEVRPSIIREAGKSIRAVAEQAAGGALSPSIIAAAIALSRLTC
ncbi:MAG: hypothetical protein JWR80_6147 [Bradyrhizobium sp.]|nr:hypothetical protein [Bradyrhizobium sp.]